MMGRRYNNNGNDRMNGGNDRYQYNFNNNDHRRRYNDRSNTCEEPEWFSGGPTSQNDTIELRGFDQEYSSRGKSPTSRTNNDTDDEKPTKELESEISYESDTDQRYA